MSQFRLRQIATADELREQSAPWDDLWHRSDVASPAARAELVALRVDHLAARATFRALVVQQGDRFVAALPLVARRLKGLLNVGALPCNCWMAGGALLLDPAVDSVAALDCLIAGVETLPWPLLWLDQVPFTDPIWVAFRGAVSRCGLSASVKEHYRIGQVGIAKDWQGYLNSMKGEHRRKLNRLVRKLGEAGGSELSVLRTPAPEQLDALLQRGFEVEHRGWKGDEGTSILSNPEIVEQYRREALVLARLGHLELIFLNHAGQAIAFVYGWRAKGVHFFAKIGYDESFARFAPGQQLTMKFLEFLHGEPDQQMVDFAGPYKDFHRVWTNQSYPVGRLVVATPRLLSRTVFQAYTVWQPRMARMRRQVSSALENVRVTAFAAQARLRRLIRGITPTPPGTATPSENDRS